MAIGTRDAITVHAIRLGRIDNERWTGMIGSKSLSTMATRPGFRQGFAAGLAMLILVFGGALGFRATLGTTATASATGNSGVPPAANDLSRTFEMVARRVGPAVVNINTEQVIHSSAQPDPFHGFFGDDSPFGSFFNQKPRDYRQRSLGSGVIVAPNGYILTNNHVVENASKISIKLDDGREMDATVAGTDAQTDLAILKVKAENLPVLPLAKSDQIQVGDWVLAFGSPFGLEKTMTAGIISAKGRVIGAGPYDNFLQTDAAINPGNSGGPLVNLNGEVVGINTMIASQNGGFQGVGFAIPSVMAADVYGQIVKSGKVTRGWLGVHIQDLTPQIAKGFNLGDRKGVLVSDVDPDSPAAKAGLKSGDIIVEYAGKSIQTARDLSLAVAETKVGAPSRLEVRRDGRELTLSVAVGERPRDVAEDFKSSRQEEHGRLGVTVENVTAEAARELNLSSNDGALVTEVKPGSPSEEGGVRAGDVIREINHNPVNRAADLQTFARSLKQGSTVLMKVERQGQTLFLAFDLS